MHYIPGFQEQRPKGQKNNFIPDPYDSYGPVPQYLFYSKSSHFAKVISHYQEGSGEVLSRGLGQVHLLIHHSLEGWLPSQAVSPSSQQSS